MNVVTLSPATPGAAAHVVELHAQARRCGMKPVISLHHVDVPHIIDVFGHRRREVRALVVRDLGTFSMFVAEAINILFGLTTAGVRVIAIEDGIDTDDPGSLSMLSGLASLIGSAPLPLQVRPPVLSLCPPDRSAARAAARRATRRTSTRMRAERPRRIRLGLSTSQGRRR